MRLCFGFLKSPVIIRKFCICPMFFVIEWFLMVSISLFKCTFAVTVVYFSVIVSKIWCNIMINIRFDVYYVCNFAFVGKEAIRFIYTITIYCLCFFPAITSLLCILITDLIFAMQLWLIFTLFLLNILWYLWLFGKCFWIKRRRYLPMCLAEIFTKCFAGSIFSVGFWVRSSVFPHFFCLSNVSFSTRTFNPVYHTRRMQVFT